MRPQRDTQAEDSAAAGLGLRIVREDEEPEAVEVWAVNALALAVVMRCPARWLRGAPVASGLQAELLPWVMDRLGVNPAVQLALLDDVRLIERAALDELARRE